MVGRLIRYDFLTRKLRMIYMKRISEYRQEIPQSHTADQPMAPWGRAKQ